MRIWITSIIIWCAALQLLSVPDSERLVQTDLTMSAPNMKEMHSNLL